MRRCKQCKDPIPPAAKCTTITQKKGFCSFSCEIDHKAPGPNPYNAAKKPARTKKKPKSISRLRNDVAELVQKLVRLKAADQNGMVKCWTCPAVKHWKEMQGGHFIERAKTATKMLEENIHPQCPYCNQWGMKQASKVLDYRREMINWYGDDFVSWLESEAKKTVRHTRQELQQLIAGYTEQIKELEKIVP